MTKKQSTMPTINRNELYTALYVPLDENKKKDSIRRETLKTLLKESDGDELEDIIKNYNKIQKARVDLGNEDANETNTTLDKIADYWQATHDLYVCYLEALRKKQVRTRIPINKILIYEAPPMPNEKGEINYILAESCKGCNSCEMINHDEMINGRKKCDSHKECFVDKPSGAYFKTIEVLGVRKNIKEILVDQGILFIDLCPLPLPMTTDIRRDVWGKPLEENDDKPLSVVLLELALKFAIEKGVKISETPTIAMGTPSATSQSIYLYFEKKKWSGSCFKKPNNLVINGRVINFSELLKTNEKYVEKGQILPLYASNIISGSNTPNAELLKRIF